MLRQVQNMQENKKINPTGTFEHCIQIIFSTGTAVLETQTKLSRICDVGNYSAVLDLATAFDVVNTDLLKRRLQIRGFST